WRPTRLRSLTPGTVGATGTVLRERHRGQPRGRAVRLRRGRPLLPGGLEHGGHFRLRDGAAAPLPGKGSPPPDPLRHRQPRVLAILPGVAEVPGPGLSVV